MSRKKKESYPDNIIASTEIIVKMTENFYISIYWISWLKIDAPVRIVEWLALRIDRVKMLLHLTLSTSWGQE